MGKMGSEVTAGGRVGTCGAGRCDFTARNEPKVAHLTCVQWALPWHLYGSTSTALPRLLPRHSTNKKKRPVTKTSLLSLSGTGTAGTTGAAHSGLCVGCESSEKKHCPNSKNLGKFHNDCVIKLVNNGVNISIKCAHCTATQEILLKFRP